jgi:biofilm protein TabA
MDLSKAVIWGRPAAEVVRAMELLRGVDLAGLPVGRHEIDGPRVVAIVDEYATRPAAECRLEAHRRNHDIQIVLAGRERIGIAPVQGLRVIEPYDESRDVAFFEGRSETITLAAGQAAIFSPADAHAPQMAVDGPQVVRKVVVKVAVA